MNLTPTVSYERGTPANFTPTVYYERCTPVISPLQFLMIEAPLYRRLALLHHPDKAVGGDLQIPNPKL